jgi:hypothetical protein
MSDDYCAKIIKRWEASDRHKAADKQPGEPVRLVSKDGVASASELQRDLDNALRKHLEQRPAQSTVDAFWYLVRLKEPDRLAAWLDNHPREKSHLLKLLETSSANR